MTSFESVLESISSWILGNGAINSVTKGDPNELDVRKATKFPVGHIIPTSMILHEGYTEYSFNVWLLGQDKWNSIYDMSLVAQQFMTSLTRGNLTSELGFQVQDLPSSEMMYDYGQNRLYGWDITVTIQAPNDIENCG